MLVLLLLMLVNEGLYDESPLAFPGILVFAGMFGSRRLFLAVLAGMLSMLAGLYGLHQGAIFHSLAEPLGPVRPIIMSSVLLVTAFFIWLLTDDLDKTWSSCRPRSKR